VRLDPTATTLAEFFSEFRALVEDGLTSNGRQAYARAWTLRVGPTLGSLPLVELRPLTIAKAKALWSGSESTKGDALALLSRILGLAVMDGLLPANPCRSLPRTRGKAHESEWTSRALDDLQVRRMLLLTSFHPFGQRALAGLAFTGLRLGELVGLRWEDLNEQQGYLTVRRTLSPDGHGRLEERPTKSGKSRQVPILEELSPWLDASRRLGREHIFTGKLGGPFDSTNLARAIRWRVIRDQIATFADGQPLRFHDLRHTFLSRLARQGIAPAHIQKVAGHASITTTERYTHISGTEAALAVRDAINGANREVTFRGGEHAARTGHTPQNPRESGGLDL
jgi:integrase